MKKISIKLCRSQKRRIEKEMRKTKDAGLRTRMNIVRLYASGYRTGEIANAVKYDRSAAIKVAHRFMRDGEEGLRDHREDNGIAKVDEDLMCALAILVGGSPQDYGWGRPTWTRELFREQLYCMTRTDVSESTVGRMLRELKARWGHPRPIVLCPWSKKAKARRLRKIKELVDNHPSDEVVFYEDEVDIHLNPKIGHDWMLCGEQKKVVTPGINQKYYLAGAMDVRTAEVVWAGGEKKNASLFLKLLTQLDKSHPHVKKIHLILDNSSIHSSKAVKRALVEEFGGRIVLHFLPPYSPEHNLIERFWQDLHANVTRNHRCKTMDDLMTNVYDFLEHLSFQAYIESIEDVNYLRKAA